MSCFLKMAHDARRVGIGFFRLLVNLADMAPRNTPTPPKPPTVSKQEGKRRLASMVERGQRLLAARPLRDGQEDVWSEACLDVIRDTFGDDSNHQNTFIGQIEISMSDGSGRNEYDRDEEQRDAAQISRRIGVLQDLIQQLDVEIGFESPLPAQPLDFWADIHPAIARAAKPRFDSGQFADSVEAALKEVNSMVKDCVRRKTGQDLDGATLMQTAFSLKSPVISLDDLSTESGRNVQLGYMQIYAGATCQTGRR
jgi:uncharacterized protein (TIGR02391 family)